MELASIFANNILPILAVAVVGFWLARFLRLDVNTLARITLYAFMPALIFQLLITSNLSAGEFGQLGLFTIGTTLGVGAIAWLVTHALRVERVLASAMLITVMFSNGGNYGIPLAMFAFGQEAMARASIYFVISVILTYTLGIVVASSGHRGVSDALLGVLKNPTVYAAAAGGLVLATGSVLPPLVMRPIELLSSAAVPAMLLVLGMQLGRVDKFERLRLVGLVVGLRLVVSALVGFGLAQVIGLTGATRQAGILQTAMPVAVVTTILAVEFRIEPAFVTSVVFLSTLLSPITLTPLIAWLR